MQRAIKPAWLIRQAYDLMGAQRRQPRNANLRRAVSAAYYALFHHIAVEASRQILPNGAEAEQYALARYVQHAAVKDVCKWVSTQAPDDLDAAFRSVRGIAELRDVTITFPVLLDARERADYDHLASFTKAEARANVEAAEDSIEKLDNCVKCPEREMFLACVALRSGMRVR